jgi:phosphoribosylformimino-5-aminoimidazole carboxamide ribotide isomerase
MEIIPAVYIFDGKVVALYKGSFKQKEFYYKSPVVIAQNFERDGAKKLYVADLNGHMKEKLMQKNEIKMVIDAVKIPVILEASYQNIEEIKEVFDMGASQAVLKSPPLYFVKEAIDAFGPEKIIVQIFAKRSELIEKREKLRADDYTDVVDYAEKLVPLGVKTVIYKDQRSEGTLIHPNYDEVDRLFLIVGKNLKIYSSGGISEEAHLKLLKKIGAAGAIIGKAFYENIITVKQAQEAAG